MNPAQTSRRRLLRGGAAFAGIALVAATRRGGELLIPAAHAQDPMTIFAVANTALSVIRSFSGSGGGGLGAMLEATFQYQKTIAADVEQVIRQLNVLSSVMINLPQQMRELLKAQALEEEYARLRGVGTQYFETLAALSSLGVTPAEKRKYGEDIEEYLREAKSARSMLTQNATLLAAVAAPLALALEVSLTYKAGRPALVPEILNSHIAWYRAMQDPLIEDSVAAELFRLSSEHDGLEQRARKTLLGKQVGTKPGEGTIGCVRYVEQETKRRCVGGHGGGVKSAGSSDPGGIWCEDYPRPGGQTLTRRLVGTVSETPNKEQVMQLNAASRPAGPAATQPAGTCSVITGPFKPNDGARQQAIEQSSEWRQLVADVEEYRKATGSMNNIRIQMASYANAMVVIAISERKARARQAVLGYGAIA